MEASTQLILGESILSLGRFSQDLFQSPALAKSAFSKSLSLLNAKTLTASTYHSINVHWPFIGFSRNPIYYQSADNKDPKRFLWSP
ncbi:hypothetical protein TNIN_73251 [Trichonephila inaurata madagascariensis]|uniref:Uncharacterized protein n=1 Tax=Trichonephila inaurata madagascariensis TaxID=2747483 RepID=A0A8X6YVP9_9ARAC|nr:hypothetical protein TNIN_73251 [Trichonephila inaurata madagascariensis]